MSLEQEEKENKEAQPEVKEEDVPEVQRELSKVATNPKQNILILAVIVAIILYLVFYFFILSSKDGEKNAPRKSILLP